VKALENAGIEVLPGRVQEGLTYQVLTDENGNLCVVGDYNLDESLFPAQYRDLAGPIPLLIAKQNENGGWGWRKSLLKNFYQIGGGLTPEVPQLADNYAFGALHVEYLSAGPSPNGLDWARTVFNSFKDKVPEFRFYHLVDPMGMSEWFRNNNISSDQVLGVLERVVRDTLNRLPEGVTSVIVVNEPYIAVDRENDPFYLATGNYDYILQAFRIARETKPEMLLIYNDSQNHSLLDREETGYTASLTKNMVDWLNREGLIDAVGLQMHIRYGNPPKKDDLIRTMRYYGVPVVITELDVDMREAGHLSYAERLQQQAKIYKTVIDACLESGVCENITFWGINDFHNWRGEQSMPTLFDKESRPKLAYYVVLSSLYAHLK
jgi:GH35 family endo-1,4-beta-xylanase